MRYFLFFNLLFAFSIQLQAAHGGTIKGIVRDASDKSLVIGASVQLKELNIYAATDEIGSFVFPDLENGVYTLEVRQLGYAIQEQKTMVSNHETVTVKFELAEAALDLGSVVIQANTQAPTQTLSQLDIQLRPVQSSQDILRMVPGLFIAQHAGGGKAEQIFLRGFDIDHGTDIALFADGIPVNMVSHAHGQGYADLHFLIPELVQRVDFQKGPYQAEVGDFATAGQAQFQTPMALESNFIKMEAGQFDTYRLAAALDLLGSTAAANGTQAYIAGEQLFSDAYFEAPQHFRRGNYFAKLHKTVDQKQSFSLSLSNFSSSWQASGQIPERAVKSGQIGRFGANEPTEGGQTSRFNANLVHHYILSDKSWVKNQFYYSKYAFELYSNFTFFLEDPENGDQIRQKENRQMAGYKSSFQYTDRLWNRAFNFNAGLQLRLDDVKNDELSHTRNRSETLLPLALGDVQEINAGLFVKASSQLSSTLNLEIGGRFDQFYYSYQNKLDSAFQVLSTSRNLFSPKANLTWQARKKLQFFARAGTGFHSNDARVVLTARQENILPRAWGWDLGMQFNPGSRLFLQVCAWQLDLEQEFVYVGDAAIVEPGGRTRRQGVDLSLRWQLLPVLFFDGDYTWTHARARDEAEGEQYIPLAPVHTASGGFSLQHKKLSGSLRGRWLGNRSANASNSLQAEGYFIADAQIRYTPLWRNGKNPVEFSISAQNLLNSAWKEAQFETTSRLRDELEPVTEIHYTPGTPFAFKAGMTFKF